MNTETMTANEKQLTPQDKQALLLAGVGPLQEKLGWPHFTKLTGAMLRKLVDAGAVRLQVELRPEDFGGYDNMPPRDEHDVFKNGNDEESLAFLEKFPKFMAEGYCGEGTISIDTIVSETKLTQKEIIAFANLFHRANDFGIWENQMRDDNHEKLFAYAWFD